MKVSPYLLRFLRNNEELINSYNFDQLYKIWIQENDNDPSEVFLLSEILHEAGIDPLPYMKEIPCGFFYDDNEVDIKLPNNVTSIGEQAFTETNIRSISIPNSVVKIGEEAFASCSDLKSIIIPDSVIKLGINVFAYCSNLENVKISNSLKVLPYGTFSSCSSLREIALPDSMEILGKSVFNNCLQLQNIYINNGLKRIEEEAFAYCLNLRHIYFNGTKLYWSNKIQIAPQWNNYLLKATLHCVDGNFKYSEDKNKWVKI